MKHLDRTTYIADISLAAKRMGIALGQSEQGGLYQFSWYDTLTDSLIKGEPSKDRIQAFELACDALTSYLHVKDHATNPQQSPDSGA